MKLDDWQLLEHPPSIVALNYNSGRLNAGLQFFLAENGGVTPVKREKAERSRFEPNPTSWAIEIIDRDESSTSILRLVDTELVYSC